jgi:hypothetical protein
MDEWVWSIGGMILTGENWSTGRETHISVILSTTNPTWTELGLNPGCKFKRPATDRLSHGTAWQQFPHDRNKTSHITQHLYSLWPSGQRCKDMRSTLSPVFTSSKMKAMFGLVSQCCQQLVDYLEQCYQQPLEQGCDMQKGKFDLLQKKYCFRGLRFL